MHQWLFGTLEHGGNQLHHWEAHTRQKNPYVLAQNPCNCCQNHIQSQKNSQIAESKPINSYENHVQKVALSRKSKPRAGVSPGEYTVKVAKYLPYTYTLTLYIIAGHSQTIYTELNRPSAGFGKEKYPLASILPSFFISLQQVCIKLSPNSNSIHLKTPSLSVPLEILANSEPTL